MIDLNKLRPVDLVYVDVEGDGILSMFRLGQIANKDCRIFPILLTPKLLVERCGFDTVGGVSKYDKDDAEASLFIVPNPLQRGSWLLCYKDVKMAINALHELQQCYACLFKKELEIK
jgi:hypothetical protein